MYQCMTVAYIHRLNVDIIQLIINWYMFYCYCYCYRYCYMLLRLLSLLLLLLLLKCYAILMHTLWYICIMLWYVPYCVNSTQWRCDEMWRNEIDETRDKMWWDRWDVMRRDEMTNVETEEIKNQIRPRQDTMGWDEMRWDEIDNNQGEIGEAKLTMTITMTRWSDEIIEWGKTQMKRWDEMRWDSMWWDEMRWECNSVFDNFRVSVNVDCHDNDKTHCAIVLAAQMGLMWCMQHGHA